MSIDPEDQFLNWVNLPNSRGESGSNTLRPYKRYLAFLSVMIDSPPKKMTMRSVFKVPGIESNHVFSQVNDRTCVLFCQGGKGKTGEINYASQRGGYDSKGVNKWIDVSRLRFDSSLTLGGGDTLQSPIITPPSGGGKHSPQVGCDKRAFVVGLY
jgi:hypothetical protein